MNKVDFLYFHLILKIKMFFSKLKVVSAEPSNEKRP